MRERMSRPSSSVPIQCAGLGAASRDGRFCDVGSAGAIQGAASATITRNKVSASPIRPGPLCLRNSRNPLIRIAPADQQTHKPNQSAGSLERKTPQSSKCNPVKEDSPARLSPEQQAARYQARKKLTP